MLHLTPTATTLVDTTNQGMTLTVIVERAGNNWCAYTPDNVGVVVATGPTREAAIEQFRSALQFHFEGMREDGEAVPQVTQLEIRETVAA